MNRCLTEGRKAFRDRLEGIERGAECERLAPHLSRLADGEATAEDLAALRPHIRTCLSCRAALREYRSAPRTAAALVPAAAFVTPDRLALLEAPARALEGVAGWAHKAQNAVELASAQKVAAVAASTAVIAGGGAAITVEQVERRPDPPKHAERAAERLSRPEPAPVAGAPMATIPAAAPAPPPLTRAEQREREAKRKTPPAQQEFEPAWAAGEPTSSTDTATASTSTYEPAPSPAPAPTRSGAGAQEFAP